MFESKHTRLLEEFVSIFGLPTSGDENARAWTMKLAEQFNFTFPNEGWGTKRASATRPPSTDVLSRREEGQLMAYDVVVSAGAPNAFLNPSPEGLMINEQIFIPVDRVDHLHGGGEPTENHNTLLGVSLFWLMGGILTDRLEQVMANLEFIKTQLKADYVRWFFTVGGDLFDGADPWGEIGSFYSHSKHEDTARIVLDVLKSVGLKSHVVLVGSRAQADNESKQFAIVDRAANVLKNHTNEVILTEMWNEYEVNGGTSHELRAMARRFRSQMPVDSPITLSTPTSVMSNSSAEDVLYEINKMYGPDSGANVLTIHSTRPIPIWNPKTVRQLGIHLPIFDSEPRGPGASAGGDLIDANLLGMDYRNCVEARASGYCFHSMPGVWGGHCNSKWPDQNRWANIYDVTNIDNIAGVLSRIRDSGGFTPMGEEVKPYPDENVWWLGYSEEVMKLWEKAGRNDLVKLLRADPRALLWFSRMGHSSAHDDLERAKAKHLKELADELGV